MGFFKKIFKPVSKVLDKIIPNEVKPFLPYAAAFAPMIAPGIMGAFGGSALSRAAIGGGLNIFGQLSQEGNEGDINLLSAGLGALTGAMTGPGAADKFSGMTTKGTLADQGIIGSQARMEMANRGLLTQAKDLGLEGLAKGSEMFAKGMADPFSMAGLKAAALPAATATGDLMFAQAKRDQDAYDDAMAAEADAEYASDAARAFAIRQSMESYGFTEQEILDAIEAAGYKAGGRVGFRFGGIDKAIEGVSKEIQKDGQDGIMTAAKEDPLLVEEYNKYVFDLMEQRPDAKPMTFQDFKRMIKSGMKTGGRVKAEEGGLMDLGGKEMDLRSGGFVPIGEEEKADDVPARLSKNEFVMTADAVRAAGGGSVNEGAKRMYDVMNKLEAKA
jgi:hypothetical protein